MKNLKIKIISKYLRPYKKELIIGAISLLIVNIFSVIIPLEVKNIIDELQVGFSSTFIITKSLWLILLASLMAIIRLSSRQIVFGIGRKVEVNLRQKIFDHLLMQDPDWVQKKGSGDIISRATSDVENVRRLLGFTVLSLCNIVLAYSLTIPSMFLINKMLTISALMIFPIILGIVGLFGGKMVNQRKLQQESLSKLSDLIQEDLSGISSIKIYSQEESEKKEFSKINNSYRDAAIKLARTASTLFPLLQGISSISLLLLLSIGSSQLQNGFITIGGLIALILYVERLVFPTALLGFTLNTFQLGQVSLDRIEDILQSNPKITNSPNSKVFKKKVKGAIEAKNLKIKYQGSKFNALDGINFKINPGELVAIVGPVGCGKTTLAKALGRTIEIDSQQIFIDGSDIKNIKLNDLRKNIAIVPQEAFLFTSSISENLRFGKPKASRNLVKDSAVKAGLIEDVNSFPNGFETLVGERGITLSGGQRQRSALARALLINAPVIVLDDALASVDNKTASLIINQIRKNKKNTILMISHQLAVAATCDRVLVMNKGKIVQEGLHKNLLRKKGLYKNLWERELAVKSIESN
ncbi:MAG: hypothetical protein CMK49_03190 [Prochlorococcus sp. SP3034]|nr:hypothetical protein [Prochlorococcus sp. SP3034]|tara:strand:+ start:11196 stop:12944 length:1749 start_codon:yes stop_codon:yes gene_type:complete